VGPAGQEAPRTFLSFFPSFLPHFALLAGWAKLHTNRAKDNFMPYLSLVMAYCNLFMFNL
jgi:hypothetical protein